MEILAINIVTKRYIKQDKDIQYQSCVSSLNLAVVYFLQQYIAKPVARVLIRYLYLSVMLGPSAFNVLAAQ